MYKIKFFGLNISQPEFAIIDRGCNEVNEHLHFPETHIYIHIHSIFLTIEIKFVSADKGGQARIKTILANYTSCLFNLHNIPNS